MAVRQIGQWPGKTEKQVSHAAIQYLTLPAVGGGGHPLAWLYPAVYKGLKRCLTYSVINKHLNKLSYKKHLGVIFLQIFHHI